MLTNGPLAESIAEELATRDESFIVPHLIDIEVTSAIRRIASKQRLDPHWCRESLDQLAALPAERYPHTALIGRIWELRHNFTAYDAAYIALAEATDSVLFSCDEKLRGGHQARVVLFAR